VAERGKYTLRSPVSKVFFLVFDVTVVIFPLLYKVLHHVIFTDVYHFNLYSSSLYIHPEFFDGINYLSCILFYLIYMQFLALPSMLYYVHEDKILLNP